jgi:hypothetical protein
VSKHFTTEIAKCRNAKLRHGVSGIATWSFGVSGIATWSVKISHHKKFRNHEMKCEIATWSFGDRNMEFQEFATCEIVKCRKGLL